VKLSGKTAASGRTMPKPKKKTLPKNFEALLEAGDLAALKDVFATCDPDARGGYAKQTALAFDACPDELAAWLVAAGADLSAADTWGSTPLHARAGARHGRIETLLALGADVNATNDRGATPLHAAADAGSVENVRRLIANGAAIDARNAEGMTPLEAALRRCTNIGLEKMADAAECLLDAGAARTPATKAFVEALGRTFEFHRDGFDPASRDAASAALDRLYRLFDVVPVPRRAVHDGVAPIAIHGDTWQQRHDALWNALVPSSGAAATVQGEVIRITGRIAHELHANGGANWDPDFGRMADALRVHFRAGEPLSPVQLDDVDRLVSKLEHGDADTDHARLSELAVAWVARNPAPIALARPDYAR
jgi:hypothetical protein